MSDLDGFDAYSPVQIARRIELVGETKARMAALPLALLGVLAGAFIGVVAHPVVQIAVAKQEMPMVRALLRGVLCNVLGGAVWVAGVYHVIYKRQPLA
ncbi:MAG: formate/nitrite transporter family protein [Betaproteobacteria bacterium]|nr:formate/nitrite transporter family protein [Betaproteobacteria bacterium]